MSAAHRAAFRFQSILCPIDFSTQSRLALQHALAVAQRTGGLLTTMHADDPMLAAAAGYNEPLLTKQARSEIRRLLTKIGAPLDRDHRAFKIVTVIGQPVQEILKVARQTATDLIVMGTHGRSGVGRMFFGSVTSGVLRRTGIPVLAVPPGARARALKNWPGERILCAVDLGPQADHDVRAAARLAEVFDADLILIHVVTRTDGAPWLKAQVHARDKGRLKAARARLERLADGARSVSGSHIESMTVLGRPGDEIPAAATRTGSGVILLTLRRGQGLFGTRQGTTTYQVLCKAAPPVLALRPSLSWPNRP